MYIHCVGYEFQCDRRLVTLFSAPNYCGEFDNAGAIMSVGEDLVCSFRIVRPVSHRNKNSVMGMTVNGDGVSEEPGV